MVHWKISNRKGNHEETEEQEKTQDIQKPNSKTVDVNCTILFIMLSVNGLKSPIKGQRLA